MGEDYLLSRRNLLKGIAASGTLSLAGCQSIGNSKDSSGNSPDTDSSTASPDQAPEIISQSAQPQDNGRTLVVGMRAEDDESLEYAAIRYGDKVEERLGIEGRRIDLNGELTNLGSSELEEKPGQVLYLARDTAGQETRVEAYPDENPPELLNFSAEPTENAGEIDLLLEGRDDVGLEELKLLLGEQSQLQQNVSGKKEHSIDQQVAAPDDARFKQNTVTASVEDWNGNATESEAEAYVRKYDVMEDTQLDIGAVYLPWMGSKFGGILGRDEVEPTIGYYDDLVEEQDEPVNQHIDQMQGHGIGSVMFTFGEYNDHQRFRNFEGAALSNRIDVEPFVAIPPIFNGDRDIDEDLDFIRENVFTKSNCATVEGRPMVQFWNPSHLVYNRRDQIEDEYGSLTGFLGHVRDRLSRDGADPFLVGDANGRGYNQGDASFEGAEEFWANWDGFTSWTGRTVSNETVSQETAMEFVRKDYENIRSFADKHGQDFYPMVIPGFNDTHNEEWGQDRIIPRSTSAFRDRLHLAQEYADGRINIYSFNEWAEGSQIESGTFLGKDYGTDYLEAVQEFQSRG